MLTGRASPHLHNGVIHIGDENTYVRTKYVIVFLSIQFLSFIQRLKCLFFKSLIIFKAVPQWGILVRSEVGLLVHEGDGQTSKVPGSRLKTPSLPIWVTLCHGHHGVLFNTNKELLRNYHAERRYFYIYNSSKHIVFNRSIKHQNFYSKIRGAVFRLWWKSRHIDRWYEGERERVGCRIHQQGIRRYCCYTIGKTYSFQVSFGMYMEMTMI